MSSDRAITGHLASHDGEDEVARVCVQETEKRYCRVPRCLERRLARGQENGRFLMEYWQDERSVYVTIICPDCGTQHQIEIVKQ